MTQRSPLDLVLSKLEDVRGSDSEYKARCPAHDDRTPSLSVSEGDDGRVLLCCHAGCETEEIVRCMGLRMSDLFPPSKKSHYYIYRDEQNRRLFMKERKPGKHKQFFLYRRKADKWIPGLKKTRQVLYNLPEVMERGHSENVIFVEGEKDVCTLVGRGYLATTNSGGAGGAWRKEYNETLRGCNVVIVPDEDKPGLKHARKVARALSGIAASVKVLRLPGLERGTGQDVSDWLEQPGNSTKSLRRLIDACAPYAKRVTRRRKMDTQNENENTNTDADEEETEEETGENGLEEDVRAGEAFAAAYGKSVRFCPEPGRGGQWLVWDGCRWKRDSVIVVERMFQDMAVKRLKTAVDKKSDVMEIRYWTRYMRMKLVHSALDSARSHPKLIIHEKDLDTNPWRFNCTNGTLNLRTGTLRPHRRRDHITRLSPVVYAVDADQREWMAYLKRAVPDKRMRLFLRRMAGYTLTGTWTEECLAFLCGKKDSGKSTFIEAMRSMFGDYGATINFAEFLEQAARKGTHRPEIVVLRGCRYVGSVEVKSGASIAVDFVKWITGGDMLAFRGHFKTTEEIQPTFKFWLAANERPVAKGADASFWSRIFVFPFDESIPHTEQDPKVKQRLSDPAIGGPAVLAWAVRGCRQFQQKGLQYGVPKDVRAALRRWQEENDPLKEWIDECCVRFGSAQMLFSEAYASYVWWSEMNHVRPLGRKMFGKVLMENGYTKRRNRWMGRRTVVIGGLKLHEKRKRRKRENGDKKGRK